MPGAVIRRPAVAVLLVLVALGVVLAVLRLRHGPQDDSAHPQFTREGSTIVVAEGAPLMARLHVQPVEASVLAHGLRVPATVQAEPRRSYPILTPVTGRVIRADLQPGQSVRKGDVLAVLASGDLDQAYADLVKARAQVTYQERVVRRARDVLSIGGNAQKDLDAALNDLAQAQAERQRAERRLESLNSRTDRDGEGMVHLLAPVDGLVASTSLAEGVNITDPTAVQAVILDISRLQIDAALPEDTSALVRTGQSMTVRIPAIPGRVCSGTVSSIDPALHADTRRVVAHMLCDNAAFDLRPNMFADAEIAVPQPPMIMIPKTALLMNNDRLSVFVQEGAPRHFQRRAITVSYDEGENVRVLTGLKAGERVVTRGAILLNDND